MATNRTDREMQGTDTDSERVRPTEREYAPGDDPVAEKDPNAEEASLATDGAGLGQVDELRREAEAETTKHDVGNGDRSVGSHQPGGDGLGTKKFKHDHDPAQPKDRQQKNAGENENAKRFNRPGSQPEHGNKGKAK